MGHDRSELPNDDLVAENEYGRYCVPRTSMHRPAARTVLAGEVWERATLDYLLKCCTTGDVVHAGTYFGDFIPALSAAVCDSGRLWAFEPNPTSYRCAERTVQLNALANVTLTNAALGMRPETVPMLVKGTRGRDLGGASRIVPEARTASPGHAVDVRVVRLDDVLPEDRHLGLLQLDVEGHERQALSGAMETIRRCRPVLVLESLPDRAWLQQVLKPLEYAEVALIEGNTVLRSG